MQVQLWLVVGDFDVQVLYYLQLGLQYEQQYQELLLIDIKYVFWCNLLQLVYCEDLQFVISVVSVQGWIELFECIVIIGVVVWLQYVVFVYDNELLVYCVLFFVYVLVECFVSNGEYFVFIEVGGYCELCWWFSEGWVLCEVEGWQYLLYWDDVLQCEYIFGGW